MKKNEFMDSLKRKLRNESYEYVCQVVEYYDEIINDLIEDGISEEEAIQSLGNIDDILLNMHGDDIIEIKPHSKKSTAFIGVLLVLGFPLWGSLLAAGVLLLLSAYIVIWCIPIVTSCLAFAGTISFIVGIFGAFPLFVHSIALGITQLGLSAIFGSMGIIGVILTHVVSKRIFNYSKQLTGYIKEVSIKVLRKVGAVC
ncbi:DUF1700 domain-containing protein [Candidatus Stoquefichus massiliensis]|uniref:DUF1700 domain-containing protein n=1 Tax=Candidatus Stoquefichus massiliensis TaxID=1470350 RepID=UPI000489191F|nr:DUF1700 domain-containing protein [Candidatus Stoquefichus massiliensis]